MYSLALQKFNPCLLFTFSLIAMFAFQSCPSLQSVLYTVIQLLSYNLSSTQEAPNECIIDRWRGKAVENHNNPFFEIRCFEKSRGKSHVPGRGEEMRRKDRGWVTKRELCHDMRDQKKH